ncbi:tyrosine--tRNA ligase [Vallitalea pronyensis]|uniref:Tyrosine--tRNA ligase n=1 Tax=Vallitalea pronyensis TaxID=1348613 RepID=A0A8J8MJD8_9FIRM|nr:tyrosine--tRNA ligase [Vallitalea pronyensis]QUI22507.1 tyrosine--tRNA ligase [Vallitalea pronyensis]
MKHVFDVLKERGYIYQATHEQEIIEALNGQHPITFYLGIDPTADSLHIGHFFALMMFRYLQDAGHQGILVIGGATALIGDPSGKSDMRKMLTKEQVAHNVEEVRILASRFIRTDGDNPALILNNADWINPYNFVDFMRDIGIHFNVNTMLQADAYANRLKEGGLTFLEMSYMLMQSYDFVHLHKTYGCTLQIGGSDQWGNIVAGTNLGRKQRFSNDEAHGPMFGLTCPLLMTREGNKMGKTESGTLWVAREKTTVFDFYQYFYNVDDCDTEMLLRLFTHVPLEDIIAICDKDIRKAKALMAFEITKLVHGEKEANLALQTAKELFGRKSSSKHMPKCQQDKSLIMNGVALIDLLFTTGFVPSKSEARRLITQGGISVNGEKIPQADHILTLNDLQDDHLIIKRGKKHHLKVMFH